MMYQLEVKDGINYQIKVVDSTSTLGVKKLYYKRLGNNAVWVLFATCESTENLENVIRIHFGSKGKIKAFMK